MVGASRNSQAIPIPSDPSLGVNEDLDAPRVNTYSKKLEFLLNTEAALRDSPIHFEVLNFTHRGGPICGFSNYTYPRLIKKYGVDLVLALGDELNYPEYFQKPITPEGIPAKLMNHEYTLKPLSERATTAEAKDLLERCKALKIPLSEKQDFPGDGLFSFYCNGDAQMHKDLLEMAGRPLQLFQEKLNSIKTPEGQIPQLLIYYLPTLPWPNDCIEPFWNEVCTQYHLNFINLMDSFNALKTSYYPAAKGHFTTYGNDLVALLLEHYLIENKIISFDLTPKN